MSDTDHLIKIVERLDRIIELLTPQPKAKLAGLERCRGVDERMCAMHDDRARISKATFADPQAWLCRGCKWLET